MGAVVQFPTGAPVPVDLDGLSAEEIWNLRSQLKYGTEEEKRLGDAWYAARRREFNTNFESRPDHDPVTVADAAFFLHLTSVAVLNWIYHGKLTGTKKWKGPRGFTWTVPAGELRRIRAERLAAARVEEA